MAEVALGRLRARWFLLGFVTCLLALIVLLVINDPPGEPPDADDQQPERDWEAAERRAQETYGDRVIRLPEEAYELRIRRDGDGQPLELTWLGERRHFSYRLEPEPGEAVVEYGAGRAEATETYRWADIDGDGRFDLRKIMEERPIEEAPRIARVEIRVDDQWLEVDRTVDEASWRYLTPEGEYCFDHAARAWVPCAPAEAEAEPDVETEESAEQAPEPEAGSE